MRSPTCSKPTGVRRERAAAAVDRPERAPREEIRSRSRSSVDGRRRPRRPPAASARWSLLAGIVVLRSLVARRPARSLRSSSASSLMIMLHELGHFFAAKRSGMKVTEFFVGFGPRLWSFRRGETEYGVKADPRRRLLRIIGMTNLEEVDPADEPRTYRPSATAQAPRRWPSPASTVHFVIAFVLMFVVYRRSGDSATSPAPTVEQIVPRQRPPSTPASGPATRSWRSTARAVNELGRHHQSDDPRPTAADWCFTVVRDGDGAARRRWRRHPAPRRGDGKQVVLGRRPRAVPSDAGDPVGRRSRSATEHAQFVWRDRSRRSAASSRPSGIVRTTSTSLVGDKGGHTRPQPARCRRSASSDVGERGRRQRLGARARAPARDQHLRRPVQPAPAAPFDGGHIAIAHLREDRVDGRGAAGSRSTWPS